MQFGLVDNRNVQEYGKLQSLWFHDSTSVHLFPRPRLDQVPFRWQHFQKRFQTGIFFRCVFNMMKDTELNSVLLTIHYIKANLNNTYLAMTGPPGSWDWGHQVIRAVSSKKKMLCIILIKWLVLLTKVSFLFKHVEYIYFKNSSSTSLWTESYFRMFVWLFYFQWKTVTHFSFIVCSLRIFS